MMVRFAKIEDKPEIAALWALCFPGDDAFCELFLNEMFAPELSLVCEDEGGTLAGMLHFIVEDFKYGAETVKAAYVYGIGTYPDFRGRGIASELICRLFSEMKEQGIPLAILVPQGESLFEFYRRTGFSAAFTVTREKFARKNLSGNLRETVTEILPKDAFAANAIFENVTFYRNHLCRSAEHWRHAALVAKSTGGGMLGVYREGGLIGYAVFEYENGKVIANEVFAEDELAYDSLRYSLLGMGECEMLAPSCPHDAVPFGMARIVDVGEMLRLAATMKRGLDFTVEVLDKQAEWNTGRWTVSSGKVSRAPREGSAFVTPEQLCEMVMGIGIAAPYVNLLFS